MAHSVCHRSWLAALAIAIGGNGCASVPNLVPVGTENGSFFTPPSSKPRLSAGMASRRDRLSDAKRTQLRVHLEILRELVNSSREFRDQIQKRQAALLARFESGEDVSPLDAELVLEAAHWFIEIDALLYELWTSYRRFLPHTAEPDPYAPYRGATVLAPDVRVKGGLIALAAEMVRLENATLAIDTLGDQLALTHWLNRGDAKRGIEPESYDRVVGGFYDPGRRVLLRNLLATVDAEQVSLKKSAKEDGELAYLLALLARSPVAKAIQDESLVARQARFVGATSTRTGAALLSPFLDLYISSLTNDVPLEDDDMARLERVDGLADLAAATLEPFDIVFVRDARVRGGVGGYSYAVVYLGRFDQWYESTSHDHPTYQVAASEIRQGDRFLELGAAGLAFTNLDRILLGQDLLVVRAQGAKTERAALVKSVLDLLLKDDFIQPPLREASEHGAVLLERLFTPQRFGLPSTPGRASVLGRLVAACLDDTSAFEVPLTTARGVLLKGENRKGRVRETLLEEVPVYVETR